MAANDFVVRFGGVRVRLRRQLPVFVDHLTKRKITPAFSLFGHGVPPKQEPRPYALSAHRRPFRTTKPKSIAPHATIPVAVLPSTRELTVRLRCVAQTGLKNRLCGLPDPIGPNRRKNRQCLWRRRAAQIGNIA